MFSLVCSRLGDLTGMVVLDLYAGSGALGLEALSRGVARVVFVDAAAACERVIRENAGVLGFDGASTVLRMDATAALSHLERQGQVFDLIFADPPYREDGDRVLDDISGHCALAREGLLVLEHSHKAPPREATEGLALCVRRRYGDTDVSLYAPRLSDFTEARE
jgi:16S rRNA (guanine966-N2)-methyltransferase